MMLLNAVVYVWKPEVGKGLYSVIVAYGLPTAVLMVLGFYFSLYGVHLGKQLIKEWKKGK